MPSVPFIPDESRLCAVWERAAQPGATFALDNGGAVTILSRGLRNVTVGPDYLDAVVSLDGRRHVGDIELHVKEADWYAHGHVSDRRYDRVILHVVGSRAAHHTTSLPTLVLPALPLPCPETTSAASLQPGPSEVEGHLLFTLAWERLLRLTEQATRELSHGDRFGLSIWAVRRMASVLGRPFNSRPMHEFVHRIVGHVRGQAGTTTDVAERTLLAMCGYAPGHLERDIGAGHIGWEGAERSTGLPIAWRRDVRPTTSPGRRILAVVRLTERMVSGDMLLEVVAEVLRGGITAGGEMLMASVGGGEILGDDRARTLVFDAVVPAALAVASSSAQHSVIDRLIAAWRHAPTLGTNAVVRTFQHHHLGGRSIVGGFWQAGAIEYQSRYGRRRGEWSVSGVDPPTGTGHIGERMGCYSLRSTTTIQH